MKGQSIKSRVSSLEKQILKLQKRISKIQEECKHLAMLRQETVCGVVAKCPDCGLETLE